MKNLKFLVSMCLAVSMAFFSIAPVFAQLGEVTPPPSVVEPTPVPVPEPTPPAPTPEVQQVITPPSDTTPPVISGLLNTSLTDIAATIVWTTDELATSQLEYGTTMSYGHQATLDASLLLPHMAVLTGLSANTTYYYCIHATDLAGNTANDCGQSFTTQAPPDTTPPVISAVLSASISHSAETITWTTSELANAEIEYGTTSGYGHTTGLNSSLGTTHSQTLLGLSANTLYHFRIKTTDASANLTTSGDYTFTTAALSVSGNVTDTTPPVVSGISNVSVAATTATLGWTTNEPAISTLEYGATSNYGSQANLDASLLLAHEAVITNLSPNTTYHYCIHATDLTGNTTDSCNHTFTTTTQNQTQQQQVISDLTAPQITSLSSNGVNSSSMTVTWTTDEAASSQVSFGLTSGYGSQTVLDSSLVTNHSVTITGLSADTEYHFHVASTDSAGNTRTSGDETFTTLANTVNNQVNSASPIVSDVAEATDSPSSITISWVTDQPADSQILYGYHSSYGLTSSINTALTTSHSVTLTGLSAGTTYHYQIKSKNVNGAYAVTTDEDFTTLVSQIPAPIISSVSNSTSQTSATVTWTTDVGATSRVEYGLNTSYDNQTSVSNNLVTSHSVTINNLAPGTTYDFRVISTGSNNDEAISGNYTFTTQAASGQAQTNNTENLSNVVHNLGVSDVESTAATLNFTTGNTPQNSALQYDIRYSTANITDGNFGNATPAQQTPIYFDFPQSGELAYHHYVILGLTPNTHYYFAIKTKDQNNNTSPASESVSATTDPQESSSADSSANQVVEHFSQNNSNSNQNTGGGNGGVYHTGGINPPKDIRAEAVDSSAILFWQNPSDVNFVRVKIVRGENAYPNSINDGQVIYEGDKANFTDINLSNGKTYYYSVFALNHLSHISKPLQFAVTPKGGVKQIELGTTAFTASCNDIDLSFGMTNDAVKKLQQYFVSLSNGVYHKKLVTGYFHVYTQTAVKKLQAKYGLAQTGIWDSAIRSAMNICFNTGSQQSAAVQTLSKDLQIGMSGSDVTLLQQFLVNKGFLASKYITGYFGQYTQTAVKAFQQQNNIQPADGVVGTSVRNLIAR
ncbi:MAG: fibronectin type III domain-containing protein [Candidatus Doudnabacteria bacterium]|nr:fibronectin type III domain-containing protein [Candidatus Doudnabacteria bacterium]